MTPEEARARIAEIDQMIQHVQFRLMMLREQWARERIITKVSFHAAPRRRRDRGVQARRAASARRSSR
jgi:hypothetical protein